MSDYISRQAAIEALAGWKISPIVLDPVPAADVRENVRGEWIEVLRDTYGGGHFPYSKCSVCQSEQIMDSNFCPNCGAQMRGDNNV